MIAVRHAICAGRQSLLALGGDARRRDWPHAERAIEGVQLGCADYGGFGSAAQFRLENHRNRAANPIGRWILTQILEAQNRDPLRLRFRLLAGQPARARRATRARPAGRDHGASVFGPDAQARRPAPLQYTRIQFQQGLKLRQSTQWRELGASATFCLSRKPSSSALRRYCMASSLRPDLAYILAR